MAIQFQNNPHYRAYVHLLKQLHDLIAADGGDSNAADAVRDQLDTHLPHLNQAEYRRAEGLCEDLYTLVEDQAPPATSLPAPPRPKQQIGKDLDAAWANDDWDRVLELLREGAYFIPLDAASYVRGRCWQEFGEPEIALSFFARASMLNPLNANYVVLVMNTLMQLDRCDEAVAIAQDCIQHTSDYRLHIKAADVLFNLTRAMDDAEAEPILRQVVSITTSALDQESALPPDQQTPSLAVAGHVLRGLSLQALGEPVEARAAFDRAISIDPNNDAARTARGLLDYGRHTASAVADFQIAVANQTALVWPYFFLAHHFLEVGNYRNCLAMCGAALVRTDRANLRADLFEWSAIAQSELGAPAAQVEQLFASAQSLAPFNARIVANLDRFRSITRPAASAWLVNFDVSPQVAMKTIRRVVEIQHDAQITAAGSRPIPVGA